MAEMGEEEREGTSLMNAGTSESYKELVAEVMGGVIDMLS